MSEEKTTTTILLLTKTTSSDYGHIKANFVEVRENTAYPVNISEHNYDRKDFQHYPNLVISNQIDLPGNEYINHKETACNSYGWSLDYRGVFSVNLQKAQKMNKTLSYINRGLQKLDNTRGFCQSFGEYVQRIMEVTKIKEVYLYKGENQESLMVYPRYSNYSSESYKVLDISDIRSFIDRVSTRLFKGEEK